MDYETMLKRGREKLPDVVFQKERFEIPKIQGHLEGNRTVLSNFLQIASQFQRDPDHLLKYILKELAAPGEVRGQQAVIGTKVPASRINEKIRQYALEFVLCKTCGKPDTKLVKEEGVTAMRCQACGAKHPIKGRI